MTVARTRYFVIASLLILTIGLGTGLVAYYAGFPAGATGMVADELRLLPHDATVVAYADVHAVMVSEVRQRILEMLPSQGSGQQDFENETGIKIDTDVDRLVACLAPAPGAQKDSLSGLALIRGRFNEAKIEALMRSHGAHVADYKGTRVIATDVHDARGGSNSLSVAFVEPGLAAVGGSELVREAVDLKGGGDNITNNQDVMNFVKTFDGNDAWAVGRFDALTGQAKMPQGVASQIPPITWFAASGKIDGGIAGTFRADTRDEESANSLRDVLRGVVAFAKLQTTAHPELRPMLDSLQLAGSGNSVTLAFDVSPQMFDQLATVVKGLRPAAVTRSK
ncbi:MAG TPA: hypothetical protein VHZ73_00435 [Vicinamibacterales bacterium]|jgi:hypothetical protein|nr:hypothetical protein [Vicinamibacterales bacterium]